MKITIPKANRDIQKAVNRKFIFQIVFSVIWFAAVSAVMIYEGYKNSRSPLGVGSAAVIRVFICIAPFVFFKSWRWFTDRSFEGRVIGCRQTRSATMDGFYKKSYKLLYIQHVDVLKENGRIKRVNITCDYDKQVPLYQEGDHVRYYRGTKFLQIISDKPNAPRICVMCGTQNLPNDMVCSICASSLIDHRK